MPRVLSGTQVQVKVLFLISFLTLVMVVFLIQYKLCTRHNQEAVDIEKILQLCIQVPQLLLENTCRHLIQFTVTYELHIPFQYCATFAYLKTTVSVPSKVSYHAWCECNAYPSSSILVVLCSHTWRGRHAHTVWKGRVPCMCVYGFYTPVDLLFCQDSIPMCLFYMKTFCAFSYIYIL